MLSRLAIATGLVVAFGLPIPDAEGEVRVGNNGGQLTVSVIARNGPDGNHRIVIEPFKEGARNGFRVRQKDFGNPAITSNDSNCDVNPLANDVVCGGPRDAVDVTMGDGNDEVQFIGLPDFGDNFFVDDEECVTGAYDTGPATVDLGQGADKLSIIRGSESDDDCTSGFVSVPSFLPTFDADGGRGDDTLDGTDRADTLLGGRGDDVLRGFGARDTLVDGGEDDRVFGGAGNDLLRAGLGEDLLVGNAGVDTVDYGVRQAPLVISTGISASGDGEAGEEDQVSGTVENLVGGLAGDQLIADTDSDANRFEGSLGDDDLDGNKGPDVLLGDAGSDAIEGGPGRDSLIGGEGNDALNARDGGRDSISCGPGLDVLEADLLDPRTPTDCERIRLFAVDDGPPGHVVGRRMRVGRGLTTTLRVACPRNARVRCRGRLTLRRPRGGSRVLGRARYAAPLGGRVAVRVRLSARPGARAFADTVERGASRKGARSSRQTLVVR